MAASLGAHETMELHEVLTMTINGINQAQLYREHVKDQQLAQLLDRQLQFTVNEYNMMVQSLNQQGRTEAVPYRSPRNLNPVYGLDHPAGMMPKASANQLDDRDVSSGLLTYHKASASAKMIAALECADPQLRRMLQQSAINCSEQAYEVWQFMNERGYYQVPTMKEVTTNTVLNMYQPANQMMNTGNMNNQQQAMHPIGSPSGYLQQ